MQRNLIDFRRPTVWLVLNRSSLAFNGRLDRGRPFVWRTDGVYLRLSKSVGQWTGVVPNGDGWYADPKLATRWSDESDAIAAFLLVEDSFPGECEVVSMEDPVGG